MEGDQYFRTVLRHGTPDLPQAIGVEKPTNDLNKSGLINIDIGYGNTRNDLCAHEGRQAGTTYAPNRFARNYVDPAFPCATVPHNHAKRVLDILIASATLAIMFLPMVLIAIAIKLTSRGPVFFKQVRVGRGGRLFWCYKFRSMCADAEKKKQMLAHLNEVSGPVFKMKRDPRLTPIGGFIRKFSIDELPQLINVLKGDMSLVGPRPPLPSEVELYNARQRGRLAVQPGLTCLWQVSGRSNIGFEQWVELDLLYIETMSFSNDLKILCKTIPAVITGNGAH